MHRLVIHEIEEIQEIVVCDKNWRINIWVIVS